MKVGACRDRIVVTSAASEFERFPAREDVPGGDQDFPRDGALSWVGLVGALLDVDIQPVPGLVGRHAHCAGSIAAQRSDREPVLDSAPVRELCPGCATRGARPVKPIRLRGVAHREISPISAAMISPRWSPTPGIVISSCTRGSDCAIGSARHPAARACRRACR
jgi:hypothetical protein